MEEEIQQRRTPRFPFSAKAEIIYEGNVCESQVKELSLYGCYLETSTPLKCGARVLVGIHSGGQSFEASATVLYSRPLLGTGVAFREVKPPFHAVLEEWLQQSLDKQNARPSIDDFESGQDGG